MTMRVCLTGVCKCDATDVFSCNCMRGRRRNNGRFRCVRCGRTLVTVPQFERQRRQQQRARSGPSRLGASQ